VSRQTTSVLFDAPGPRARRRAIIGSIVSAVVLLFLGFLAYRQLAAKDQFTYDRWGPLVDPGNDKFTTVWRRLGQGFRNTLKAAAYSIVLSVVVGTLLAVLRLRLGELARRNWPGIPRPVAWVLKGLAWVLAVLTRTFIEFFRGLPVLLSIFFAWRILPEYGIKLSALWYLVIGLTAYNSVIIAEIIRAGVVSLPRGQTEAARAIGLTEGQTLRMILLPQSFRIMMPALISQLVVVLKDTSLGFIISYEEAVRVSGQIYQYLDNLLQIAVVVATVFIAVNYSLGRLAIYVEKRLSQGPRTATLAAAVPGGPLGAAGDPSAAAEAVAQRVPDAG
jgi:glutamate transport system permease protein